MRRVIRKNIGAWILLVPTVILFVIILWQPLISGLVLSFFETKGYDAVRFCGLDNYVAVIKNSEFKASLSNTVQYVLWSLTIGYLWPVITAILLNEISHMKSFFRFALYLPVMVPAMAASLIWKFIYEPSEGGIFNVLLSSLGLEPSTWLLDAKLVIPLIVLTMTWKAFGGTMLLYLASLQGVNKDYYEAASIDGAGFFRKIWYIQIPHIRGLMGLILIQQIIGVFQIMQEPLAMTGGGPNNASLSLMLTSYNYAFKYFNAGRSMAVGAIAFVLLFGLTVIYQVASRKKDD